MPQFDDLDASVRAVEEAIEPLEQVGALRIRRDVRLLALLLGAFHATRTLAQARARTQGNGHVRACILNLIPYAGSGIRCFMIKRAQRPAAPVDKAIRERLQKFVVDVGEYEAASKIGVGSEAITRAIAGLGVRRGTAIAIEARLDVLRPRAAAAS